MAATIWLCVRACMHEAWRLPAQVMEALRDEGDEFSSQVRQHLRALSKDKDQMLRAVTDINAKVRICQPAELHMCWCWRLQ